MPANPENQAERRSAIKTMLAERPIGTQAEIVHELQQAGFLATQSSISRDFRELGVQKTPAGYQLPGRENIASHAMADALSYLRGVHTAGSHLVVLKTATGAAQRLALEIDRADWPEVIGTVSGDDTIFVATGSQSDSRNLLRRINFSSGDNRS